MLARIALALLVAGINVAACGTTARVLAKDYFVTIGGGFGPTGNQLSLERNVVFQQQVLAKQRPDKPVHDVYFADGDDDSRDVQCRDADFETRCPAARRMMAELFGDADSMDLVYRDHEVPHERGPAEKALLRRRVRALARELKAGDRLIVYVTGHGGPADENSDDYEYEFDDQSQTWKARLNDAPDDEAGNPYNTSFYLWDNESISASELTSWLDRLERDVQVVLVMVQCYAGGFAHTIFDAADADLGLSGHRRCGFFAQVHDRGAAGCTSDANEADYEEYSSYFWGALGGATRTGEPITSADYDGNGTISFAEAHSYAVLESNTIDIPVRTTGALLRRYSQRGRKGKDDDDAESAGALGRLLGALGSEKPPKGEKQLVELTGALARLAERARPDQRAILERLPGKLGLNEDATVADVRRRLKQVEVKIQTADAKLSTAMDAHSELLDRVQAEVREIWPELHATYAPIAFELASDRAAEFAERVGALSSYRALRKAAKREEELSQERIELARTEARLRRLLHTCDDVVRAANLPLVAPAEIVARYEQLLTMEEGTLVP